MGVVIIIMTISFVNVAVDRILSLSAIADKIYRKVLENTRKELVIRGILLKIN